MTFDPYEELGVPRGAAADEIEAAFRRRAKETHPDTGTERGPFERAATAVSILRDPRRRARFDATGSTEDENLDRVKAGALQTIEIFLQKVVNDYLSSRDARLDPRSLDLVAAFRHVSRGEINELDVSLLEVDRNLRFLRDLRERFTVEDVDDPIRRSFDRQIEANEARKVGAREQMEIRRAAIALMERYRFRWDKPPSPGYERGSLLDGIEIVAAQRFFR